MTIQFDFRDWKVLVAGGSRGIGRATALAFARHGARVSICARGVETLETTRAEIEELSTLSSELCGSLNRWAA